jgi:hypothetical protein
MQEPARRGAISNGPRFSQGTSTVNVPSPFQQNWRRVRKEEHSMNTRSKPKPEQAGAIRLPFSYELQEPEIHSPESVRDGRRERCGLRCLGRRSGFFRRMRTLAGVVLPSILLLTV